MTTVSYESEQFSHESEQFCFQREEDEDDVVFKNDQDEQGCVTATFSVEGEHVACEEEQYQHVGFNNGQKRAEIVSVHEQECFSSVGDEQGLE